MPSSFESHCLVHFGVIERAEHSKFLFDINMAIAEARPEWLANGFCADRSGAYFRYLQHYLPNTPTNEVVPDLIKGIEQWYSLCPSSAKIRPFLFATGSLFVDPMTFEPYISFCTHYQLFRDS